LLYLPSLASTQADFDLYKAEGLFDVPQCPMKYRRFSCNVNGSVDWLEINTRTDVALDEFYAINALGLTPVNFTVRDYFGVVTSPRLEASSTLVVENSFFGDRGSINPTSWVFMAPNLVLTNVSVPLFDLNTVTYYNAFNSCRFTNVTLRCPVPNWLAGCFGANITRANAPCLSREPNISSRYDRGVTLDEVRVMCSTPRNDSRCLFNSQNRYLPAVPGFNVIDILYRKRGEAEALLVSDSGIVARVDLWDWAASNWTRVLDRVPERTSGLARNSETLYLPPVLTNRVRVTLEQWTDADAIDALLLDTSFWPRPASLPPKKLPVCGEGNDVERPLAARRDACRLVLRQSRLPVAVFECAKLYLWSSSASAVSRGGRWRVVEWSEAGGESERPDPRLRTAGLGCHQHDKCHWSQRGWCTTRAIGWRS
jgi:hypothetical protein